MRCSWCFESSQTDKAKVGFDTLRETHFGMRVMCVVFFFLRCVAVSFFFFLHAGFVPPSSSLELETCLNLNRLTWLEMIRIAALVVYSYETKVRTYFWDQDDDKRERCPPSFSSFFDFFETRFFTLRFGTPRFRTPHLGRILSRETTLSHRSNALNEQNGCLRCDESSWISRNDWNQAMFWSSAGWCFAAIFFHLFFSWGGQRFRLLLLLLLALSLVFESGLRIVRLTWSEMIRTPSAVLFSPNAKLKTDFWPRHPNSHRATARSDPEVALFRCALGGAWCQKRWVSDGRCWLDALCMIFVKHSL